VCDKIVWPRWRPSPATSAHPKKQERCRALLPLHTETQRRAANLPRLPLPSYLSPLFGPIPPFFYSCPLYLCLPRFPACLWIWMRRRSSFPPATPAIRRPRLSSPSLMSATPASTACAKTGCGLGPCMLGFLERAVGAALGGRLGGEDWHRSRHPLTKQNDIKPFPLAGGTLPRRQDGCRPQ